MSKTKSPSCTFEQLNALGVQDVKLGDKVICQITPKTFSTGSYGLGFAGPLHIQLPDGSIAECQASLNITVKHSKEAAAA